MYQIKDCIEGLFYLQRDGTIRDSFDLYSGLFVHNKFAEQEVWHWFLCSKNEL